MISMTEIVGHKAGLQDVRIITRHKYPIRLEISIDRKFCADVALSVAEGILFCMVTYTIRLKNTVLKFFR